MRCVLLAVVLSVLLSSVGGALAFDGSSAVTSNSVVVLGDPGLQSASAWATNSAVSAGAVVESSGRLWLAVSAGAGSTNPPVGGADFTDGTITWRPMLSRARRGLVLCNTGTADISISLSRPTATAGAGLILSTGDKVIFTDSDCPQGKVAIVTTAGYASTIAVGEW